MQKIEKKQNVVQASENVLDVIFIISGNDNKYKEICNKCSKHVCNIHRIQKISKLCFNSYE